MRRRARDPRAAALALALATIATALGGAQAPAPDASPAPSAQRPASPASPPVATSAGAAAPSPLPAAPGRRGAYTVVLGPERSPWSSLAEVRKRGSIAAETILGHDPKALSYALADETFEVVVPEAAEPAAGWGLLVWISPSPAGGALRPETRRLLAESRLLWVGPNRAGNERSVWDRWGLGLDAAWHLQRLYRVDPERVYVAGYSGGGRVASGLALLYPDVFRGGLMIMGTDWYRNLPMPDRPGAMWPAYFHPPPRALLKLARDRSRFVLLTGEHDFNRLQTKVVEERLRKEGFRHVTYLEVPGLGHAGPVPPDWLARALAALDGPPAASP